MIARGKLCRKRPNVKIMLDTGILTSYPGPTVPLTHYLKGAKQRNATVAILGDGNAKFYSQLARRLDSRMEVQHKVRISDQQDFEHKIREAAISAGCAQYNPKTAEFEWKRQ